MLSYGLLAQKQFAPEDRSGKKGEHYDDYYGTKISCYHFDGYLWGVCRIVHPLFYLGTQRALKRNHDVPEDYPSSKSHQKLLPCSL